MQKRQHWIQVAAARLAGPNPLAGGASSEWWGDARGESSSMRAPDQDSRHPSDGPVCPPRVLVIDDDPDIREVTRASFEIVGGWQVLTAASAGEGVDLARRERPDAILLDVCMPGVDGLTACRQLREQLDTRSIPVVLFTIAPRDCDPRELDVLEVRGVVGKPFDPVRLPTQVAASLGWTAPPRAA